MKRFLVTQNCNYIKGYVKRGHLESTIEAENLEEAKRLVEKYGYDGLLSPVIDSFIAEDYNTDNMPFEYSEEVLNSEDCKKGYFINYRDGCKLIIKEANFDRVLNMSAGEELQSIELWYNIDECIKKNPGVHVLDL